MRMLMTTLMSQMPTAAAVEELLPAWLAVSLWHVEHVDGEYGSAVVWRVRGGAPSLQVRWTLRGLASWMISNAAIPNAWPKTHGVSTKFRVRQTEQRTAKFRKHGDSTKEGPDRKTLVKYVDCPTCARST